MGVFATSERRLVFDINDYDETYPGPWGWDLKRLAASAVVAGRENGFKDKISWELAAVVTRNYKNAMARAHARSGDAAAISGYLGQGKAFEEAMADFAVAYADQTERDHQALVDAVESGRIAAETGI